MCLGLFYSKLNILINSNKTFGFEYKFDNFISCFLIITPHVEHWSQLSKQCFIAKSGKQKWV